MVSNIVIIRCHSNCVVVYMECGIMDPCNYLEQHFLFQVDTIMPGSYFYFVICSNILLQLTAFFKYLCSLTFTHTGRMYCPSRQLWVVW